MSANMNHIYTLMDAIFDYEIIANNKRKLNMRRNHNNKKKLMSEVKGGKKSIN